MIFNRLLGLIGIGALSFLMVGCGLTLERQQGNIISKDNKKISIGSSQERVIELIGVPLLKHPLNDKVWIYVYQRKATDKNKSALNQHLIITFNDNDRVAKVKRYNLDKVSVETLID